MVQKQKNERVSKAVLAATSMETLTTGLVTRMDLEILDANRKYLVLNGVSGLEASVMGRTLVLQPAALPDGEVPLIMKDSTITGPVQAGSLTIRLQDLQEYVLITLDRVDTPTSTLQGGMQVVAGRAGR